MIVECIEYLKTALTEIGVQYVYDKPSDISRFKSGTYALITVKEKGKPEYDGAKIAYIDDVEKGVRTYHIRRYKLEHSLTVQLVALNLAAVTGLQKLFMEKAATHFIDAENYRVELEVKDVRIVQDEAVLASGAGVELDIAFSGGIYVTRETKLITDVDTETGMIQKQKEDA